MLDVLVKSSLHVLNLRKSTINKSIPDRKRYSS